MDTIINLLPQRIKNLPIHMDFEGQKRAERLFQLIITVSAVIGFAWGYACQQFSQTMYVLFAGLALACLLTLPPWPMYRRNPLAWQKVPETDDKQQSAESKAKKSPKGKKKKDN